MVVAGKFLELGRVKFPVIYTLPYVVDGLIKYTQLAMSVDIGLSILKSPISSARQHDDFLCH